jgi:hypothetical protein
MNVAQLRSKFVKGNFYRSEFRGDKPVIFMVEEVSFDGSYSSDRVYYRIIASKDYNMEADLGKIRYFSLSTQFSQQARRVNPFTSKNYEGEKTVEATECSKPVPKKRAYFIQTDNQTNKVIAYAMGAEKVIQNGPAVIVFWNDGIKTMAKCDPRDVWSLEEGIKENIKKRQRIKMDLTNKQFNSYVTHLSRKVKKV